MLHVFISLRLVEGTLREQRVSELLALHRLNKGINVIFPNHAACYLHQLGNSPENRSRPRSWRRWLLCFLQPSERRSTSNQLSPTCESHLGRIPPVEIASRPGQSPD